VPRLSHPNRKANKRGDCAQKEIAVPLVPGLNHAVSLVGGGAKGTTTVLHHRRCRLAEPFAGAGERSKELHHLASMRARPSAPLGLLTRVGGHEPGDLPAEIHLST
jgi:hypothetical protein